jgi:hypothetical protein
MVRHILHPKGPRTPGFNQGINEKIYNKLTILCGTGNALTYVQSAAEFDGHGVGQKLLARYDGGFSKQRNTALRKLVSTMKHTSGTSITDHTDLFEKLCGQGRRKVRLVYGLHHRTNLRIYKATLQTPTVVRDTYLPRDGKSLQAHLF